MNGTDAPSYVYIDPARFRPAVDIAIHLAEAMLCVECDAITPVARGHCSCGSIQRTPLACVVRPVGDRRVA